MFEKFDKNFYPQVLDKEILQFCLLFFKVLSFSLALVTNTDVFLPRQVLNQLYGLGLSWSVLLCLALPCSAFALPCSALSPGIE